SPTRQAWGSAGPCGAAAQEEGEPMGELMQENVIFLIAALLVGLLVAWWVFAASRRTRVDLGSPDEDQGPARRNQALIDAPAAADPQVPPPTPPGLPGAGEAVAAVVPSV